MATNPSADDVPSLCPWCGESNVPWASSQLERLGPDEWLCNTCARVFRVSPHVIPMNSRRISPQADGDDGLGERMVTEEDLREVGRVAFGLEYPGETGVTLRPSPHRTIITEIDALLTRKRRPSH